MQVSLFWRTFLMIGPLIVLSVLAALQFVKMFDRAPPDQRLAWEITSVINLTRVALVNTRSEHRSALLASLAREEGIRVTPLEPSDRVESFSETFRDDARLSEGVQSRLRHLLGVETRLAARVNNEPGLWVSFEIDGDPYWLALGQERFERQIGPDWLLIGLVSLALSTVGALLISRLVNRPLSRLARAIERVSRGQPPEVLPEGAPSEIAEVNERFNRMASELAAIESDRAVALAGISHDVRTPLSRLRLEIELSRLPETEKDSMSSEIERIDQIVGKFLDYARSGQSESDSVNHADVPVVELVTGIVERFESPAQMHIRVDVPSTAAPHWFGDPMDLERILTNLLENARRYGRTEGQNFATVELEVDSPVIDRSRTGRGVRALRLVVRDHGSGVAPDQFEGLLRPFSRADAARSYQGGSGLGLTIVERIARRYQGSCQLANATTGGLQVTVVLPSAPRPGG